MKKYMLLLFVLFLVGCGSKKDVYKEIISAVEDAYDKASTFGYPTIQSVKNNFYMEDANWLADQIMSDKGAVCDIKTDNNTLKVVCPGMESQKEMRLSN